MWQVNLHPSGFYLQVNQIFFADESILYFFLSEIVAYNIFCGLLANPPPRPPVGVASIGKHIYCMHNISASSQMHWHVSNDGKMELWHISSDLSIIHFSMARICGATSSDTCLWVSVYVLQLAVPQTELRKIIKPLLRFLAVVSETEQITFVFCSLTYTRTISVLV